MVKCGSQRSILKECESGLQTRFREEPDGPIVEVDATSKGEQDQFNDDERCYLGRRQ